MPSPAPAPVDSVLEAIKDILEQIIDDEESPDNTQCNNSSISNLRYN